MKSNTPAASPSIGNRDRSNAHIIFHDTATDQADNDADKGRCRSCQMTLPENLRIPSHSFNEGRKQPRSMRSVLRTREKCRICDTYDFDPVEGDTLDEVWAGSCNHSESDMRCHSHTLDFVSSVNPFQHEEFSSLRRAIVRTLSGEQLPRGRESGPLWFGDSHNGYTIAYVFRLHDMHARGRLRYYALLALAGTDMQRALQACSSIWSAFEEIATNIMFIAQKIQPDTSLDELPPRISDDRPPSILTSGTSGMNSLLRNGTTSLKPKGIAELVDNDNFFCELHIKFVSLLRRMGRSLGGLRIKAPRNMRASNFGREYTVETDREVN